MRHRNPPQANPVRSSPTNRTARAAALGLRRRDTREYAPVDPWPYVFAATLLVILALGGSL